MYFYLFIYLFIYLSIYFWKNIKVSIPAVVLLGAEKSHYYSLVDFVWLGFILRAAAIYKCNETRYVCFREI